MLLYMLTFINACTTINKLPTIAFSPIVCYCCKMKTLTKEKTQNLLECILGISLVTFVEFHNETGGI